jgi:hypothetical protein
MRILIMKWHGFLLLMILAAVSTAQAQDKPSGKTLGATMEVYVFPKAGQAAAQQSQDEASCYEWATANTGNDPFKLAKQKESNQQQAAADKEAAGSVGAGAGAQGAVRGAAAGAILGEIANDDAGKGAAYGAAAGVIAGRRRARAAKAGATKQAEQKAATTQAATAKDLENFKKAFGVCLEAKDYLVKD